MYCECGCGQKTSVPKWSNASRGWVKGQPIRFVKGHQRRRIEVRIDPDTGCWSREGTTKYAQVVLDGKVDYLHRAVYESLIGSIPDGCELDHAVCQTKSCFNPWHLEPVPHAVNVQRGSKATLKPAEVVEIRAAKGALSSRELSTLYGVTSDTIKDIWRGETWKNLLGVQSAP